MRYQRPDRYLPNHPLAGVTGKVAVSRMILWDKLGGADPTCHWCKDALTWRTVCADHLDANSLNNVPDNIVPSCRGCNANREDGTGHGRRAPDPPCEWCSGHIVRPAVSNRRPRRFCSIRCANFHRHNARAHK